MSNWQGKSFFRFYQELRDFLPKHKAQGEFACRIFGSPSVKQVIESLGVPHTEVDLILVNGVSVDFHYRLQDGDRVSVYPVFESIDIESVIRLRPKPLRTTRFVLDVHLGALARLLRLLGFDTFYSTDQSDDALIERSVNEERILLTRDLGILKNSKVTRGRYLRHTEPLEQAREVVMRFDLVSTLRPFTRCLTCNGRLAPVEKESISHHLEEQTRAYFHRFQQCESCGRITWEGSHYEKLCKKIDQITGLPRSAWSAQEGQGSDRSEGSAKEFG